MASVEQNRQPRDLRYVNIDEQWEVHWWAAKFSVTPDQLCNSVREFGPDAAQIEQRLKAAGKESFTNMGE